MHRKAKMHRKKVSSIMAGVMGFTKLHSSVLRMHCSNSIPSDDQACKYLLQACLEAIKVITVFNHHNKLLNKHCSCTKATRLKTDRV